MFNRTFIDRHLNSLQKKVVENYLKFPLDDIIQTLLTNPKRAVSVLTSITTHITNHNQKKRTNKILRNKNISASVQQIRQILSHPCPQNRSMGSPYLGLGEEGVDAAGIVFAEPNGHGHGIVKEKRGILGLTAYDDTTKNPVTKEAVISYIELIISDIKFKFEQLLNNKTLLTYIVKHQEAIRELLQSNILSLNEVITIPNHKLNILIAYATDRHIINLCRLIHSAHLSIDDFTALPTDDLRDELIRNAQSIANLVEYAHVSVQEFIALPYDIRALFETQFPILLEKIRHKKTTFQALCADFSELNPTQQYIMRQYQGNITTAQIKTLPWQKLHVLELLADKKIFLPAGDLEQFSTEIDLTKPNQSLFLEEYAEAIQYLTQTSAIDVIVAIREVIHLDPIIVQRIPSKEISLSDAKKLNPDQIAAFKALEKYGLTIDHLLSWQQDNIANIFNEEHTRSLIKLIKNHHMSPKDALYAITYVSFDELQTINPYRDYSNHCKNLTTNTLTFFPTCQYFSRESYEKEQALEKLEDKGLTRNIIAMWCGKRENFNFKFTKNHREALEYLIMVEDMNPLLAIKRISYINCLQAAFFTNKSLRDLLEGVQEKDLLAWQGDMVLSYHIQLIAYFINELKCTPKEALNNINDVMGEHEKKQRLRTHFNENSNEDLQSSYVLKA